MSLNTDRLASQMQRELSTILLNDTRDLKIGYINITEVRLTTDLGIANIYFTVLGDKERAKVTLKALNNAKGYLKCEVAKRVKMRRVPEFVFKYDEALEYGNRIESILKEIK